MTARDGSLQGWQGWRGSRPLPDIDRQRCTGCGRCVAACKLHLLSLEPLRWQKFAVLHAPGACTGCSLCAWHCPFDAITMHKPAMAKALDSDPLPPERRMRPP